MNALDQIFGWLMIAFGVAQSVMSFRIQSASHLSLSLSGTAAAMIVTGSSTSRAPGTRMGSPERFRSLATS